MRDRVKVERSCRKGVGSWGWGWGEVLVGGWVVVGGVGGFEN